MPPTYLVFLGSTGDSLPPRPARLGLRVARTLMLQLRHCGVQAVLVDPLDFDLGRTFKPHFSYAKGAALAALDLLAGQFAQADGYVMVSPQYNHSMSPALAHLLNHFGSSLFSYRPSVIATCSAGQWGGVRAAVGMRGFLSELGCLPVSAMIHVPKAQEVFAEDGRLHDGVAAGDGSGYMARAFAQLDWWAKAARRQRGIDDSRLPDAFTRDPSQRNAT